MRTPPTHSRTADDVLAFTDIVDDPPQKGCDRCGRFLEDGSGGDPWD